MKAQVVSCAVSFTNNLTGEMVEGDDEFEAAKAEGK